MNVMTVSGDAMGGALKNYLGYMRKLVAGNCGCGSESAADSSGGLRWGGWGGYVHIVHGACKVKLLTTARGFLAFCGKRKHDLAVNGLAVGPRFKIEMLDD